MIILIKEQSDGIVPIPAVIAGNGDWNVFRQAAQALQQTYDYDAIVDQDVRDRRVAEDQLK